MIYVRPATAEDIVHVATHLRADDRQEVEHVGGSVAEAAAYAEECYALFSTAKVLPVGLFGVTADPTCAARGIVWFLATDELRGSQFSLLRESKRWLDHLSRFFPEGLHNYADTRNTLHLRWCALTGFVTGDDRDIHGIPFRYIHRLPGAAHLV